MAKEPLVALHGDSWESPQWAIAINGQPTILSNWFIRAQVRQTTDSESPMFSWSVDNNSILIGSAEVRLKSGAIMTTDTLQLIIRPSDWINKPRRWEGVLDVELSSDGSSNPNERRTVVRNRKFKITPDVSY